MPGTTGATTPVWFRWEDSGFGAAPADGTNKAFGPNATLDNDEGSNNAVRVLAPDTKEAADIIEQNFSGSFTVSFTLADPWWLRAIFGAPATSGTGPYTHTFDGTTPSSLAITEGFRDSGNERVLRGCILADVTISSPVPELVQVELTGAYADEEKLSPASIAAQPTPTYRALKYSEARLDLDGVKVAYVQDATITITLNSNLIDALDSRTAVDFWTGVREIDLDYSTIKHGQNETELEQFYGGSTTVQDAVTTAAPLTVEFTSAVDASTITCNLGGGFPNTTSFENMGNPQEAIEQNLTRWVESITVDAVNDTATAP